MTDSPMPAPLRRSMKTILSQTILAAAVMAFTLPDVASAAVVHFAGVQAANTGGPINGLSLATSGTYGGGTRMLANNATFGVAVDDSALTLTYEALSMQVPGFTTSNTVTFTAGLGQTADVTTTITYDPFTILYTGAQVLALTATTGGNYSIQFPSAMAFAALAFSGSYTVTGPTQSVSGNFAPASVAQAGAGNGFRWANFNSTGYPASSSLTTPTSAPVALMPHWAVPGNIIDVTVDGAHVTADLGQATLNSGGYGTILLTQVPEPGCMALGFIAALGLLARRRRG